MTTYLSDKRIAARPNVLVRDLGEESVLLNLDGEAYFGLDEVGTRMWKALMQGPSFDVALAALRAEYEVDLEELKSDLAQFVAELQNAGLVEVHDP
jgi:hypothetical protein